MNMQLQTQTPEEQLSGTQVGILLSIQDLIMRKEELNADLFANAVATLASAYRTLVEAQPPDLQLEEIRLQHEMQMERARLELEQQKLQLQLQNSQAEQQLQLQEQQLKAANLQAEQQLKAAKISSDVAVKREQMQQAMDKRTSDIR